MLPEVAWTEPIHPSAALPDLFALPEWVAYVSADTSHYKENECMRLAMEELLYSNGVDVILNGHCHEYERSNPVYVSFAGPPLCCMLSLAALLPASL